MFTPSTLMLASTAALARLPVRTKLSLKAKPKVSFSKQGKQDTLCGYYSKKAGDPFVPQLSF